MNKFYFSAIAMICACFSYAYCQQFTEIPTSIMNLYYSSLDWADYDSDGDLDLAIMGQNNGICYTKVYRNEGNFQFTDINAGFPGISNLSKSAIKWGDFNNDGKADLLMCGNTCNGSSLTRIYRNDGNNLFTDINAGLPANSSGEGFGGSLEWADFNNDSYFDIIIKGYSSPCNYFLKIFRNNSGTGAFTEMTNLFGSDHGSLDIADYNNDGLIDFCTQGFHFCAANCGSVKVYQNNGNFSFTSFDLQACLDGDIEWSDFDNDGLKDIIVAGRQCNANKIVLYKNYGGNAFVSIPNSLPQSHNSSFSWGDVDNDNDNDLYYQGYNGVAKFASLWLNELNSFVVSSDLFVPLDAGESDFIDIDSDGDKDLVATGNSTVPRTILYRNETVNQSNCLVAYYPFTGNAADSSGNNNHGMVNGATLTTDRFGNADAAYSFNATNDYIEVLNSTSLQLTNNYTISTWVRPNETYGTGPNYHAIVQKWGGTGNASYTLNLLPGGQVRLVTNNGVTNSELVTASSIPVNAWSHLIVRQKDDSAFIYINGILSVSRSGMYIPYLTSSNLLIGSNNGAVNGWDSFEGVIDDIKIFNCLLSETEVIELYEPIPTNCLVAYYPFTGNADDSSGNGNHGTVNGATLTTDRFGNANAAYFFNSTPSNIQLPITDPLLFNNGVTFSAWINPVDFANASIIDKMNHNGNGGFRISIRDDNMGIETKEIVTGAGDYNSGTGAFSTSQYQLNQWILVTGSWSTDDSLRIYINGIKESTEFRSYGITSNVPIFIGKGHDFSICCYEQFTGAIDEVMIYNCALSDSQVTILYNELQPCIPSPEICNNIDDDCDGLIDEESAPVPGSIQGQGLRCIPLSGGATAFSIDSIPGVIYNWSAPPGFTITAGQGTNQIIVGWNNAAAHSGIKGDLSVTVSNSCGSNQTSLYINYQISVPVKPGSISGAAKLCPGDSAIYSISTVSRAFGYTWNVPPGTLQNSGGNSNIIQIIADSSYSGGQIMVTAENACGSSEARIKNLTLNTPLTVSAINGPASGLCSQQGIIYNLPPVTNALSYNWTLPNGCSFVSGQGSNIIAVNFDSTITTGQLMVAAVNNCGMGASRTMTIKGSPPAPGIVSGNTGVCMEDTFHYSTTTSYGTLEYIWVAPGQIISGQGTKDIDVLYGNVPATNQIITVKAGNNCGLSPVRVFNNITIAYCTRSGYFQMEDLTIFPNPANEILNINWTSLETMAIKFMFLDLAGRELSSKETSAAEGNNFEKLNLKGFSPGIYILQISVGELMQSFKILIDKETN